MPLRMGGLGFSRNGTDSHAAMAYAAAAAALAPHIAKTPLGKMDRQVWQSLPALRELQASLDTLQATFSFEQGVEPRFPGNAEAFFEKFSKFKNAKLASGLQGYMSKRIQDASHAALHEQSTTEEKAVLNCRFCPEASAWLQAMAPHG
jgi:peptide subunit release factor RF-3